METMSSVTMQSFWVDMNPCSNSLNCMVASSGMNENHIIEWIDVRNDVKKSYYNATGSLYKKQKPAPDDEKYCFFILSCKQADDNTFPFGFNYLYA